MRSVLEWDCFALCDVVFVCTICFVISHRTVSPIAWKSTNNHPLLRGTRHKQSPSKWNTIHGIRLLQIVHPLRKKVKNLQRRGGGRADRRRTKHCKHKYFVRRPSPNQQKGRIDARRKSHLGNDRGNGVGIVHVSIGFGTGSVGRFEEEETVGNGGRACGCIPYFEGANETKEGAWVCFVQYFQAGGMYTAFI